MSEITDEQRAAWLEIKTYYPKIWEQMAPLLPDALTNPQPALPSEHGRYVDKLNRLWTLDDDGWRFQNRELHETERVQRYGPFTRLVPERPQVTREQLNRACLAEEVAAVNFRQARAILNFVNGTRA